MSAGIRANADGLSASLLVNGWEVVKLSAGAISNSPVTDNDLSFNLSARNNFTCTPTALGTLNFTNIATAVGQSGNILLNNTSNYAISKGANIKCDASFLSTVSATGLYRLSYYCDGTTVHVTTSGALS